MADTSLRFEGEAGAGRLDHIRHEVDPGRNHGKRHCHRLEQHERAALIVRRHHENICCGKEPPRARPQHNPAGPWPRLVPGPGHNG